jgi:hypothetical protein
MDLAGLLGIELAEGIGGEFGGISGGTGHRGKGGD